MERQPDIELKALVSCAAGAEGQENVDENQEEEEGNPNSPGAHGFNPPTKRQSSIQDGSQDGVKSAFQFGDLGDTAAGSQDGSQSSFPDAPLLCDQDGVSCVSDQAVSGTTREVSRNTCVTKLSLADSEGRDSIEEDVELEVGSVGGTQHGAEDGAGCRPKDSVACASDQEVSSTTERVSRTKFVTRLGSYEVYEPGGDLEGQRGTVVVMERPQTSSSGESPREITGVSPALLDQLQRQAEYRNQAWAPMQHSRPSSGAAERKRNKSGSWFKESLEIEECEDGSEAKKVEELSKAKKKVEEWSAIPDGDADSLVAINEFLEAMEGMDTGSEVSSLQESATCCMPTSPSDHEQPPPEAETFSIEEHSNSDTMPLHQHDSDDEQEEEEGASCFRIPCRSRKTSGKKK